MQESIEVAAIFWNGRAYTVPRPGRHHNVIHLMRATLGLPLESVCIQNQGFVTNYGRFVDRQEGLRIAQAANQIIKKHPADYELYSEDMW